ncbi:NAD(P)/FAD-dependent oxidoreductase [Oceaniglobus indicus]|uniref:NAD(P)/FAD-dependent oxidoreductase n=1 Tax=Oceaniglobus indicus TaxID=2047749 RepID=UPI000C1A101E|nr:FAD-binding oxidoreductase [Oceaniglobus indicus]
MFDVTVRGAGIFGLSIAWVCLQRGARVRVVDPHGVAAGASGGLVGALAPHTPENWNPKKAFQFDALMRAGTFWDGVHEASGIDPGYARAGRLQPVPDDRALAMARTRATSARDLWQGHATWQVVRADSVGDWAPVSPTGWLIHDTLSARIHPRKASGALAAALRAGGAEIATDASDAGRVVWANGVEGLYALTRDLNRPMGNGVKGQAALLDHDARTAAQLFADGLHIVPHADGTTAIGSTSERTYDAATTTDAQLDDVIARALAAFPVLAGARVLERWAGVRPRAPSRAPMLGPWPGRAGHFIANGGFKIGFGVAPGVADVMADLMLDGIDRIPDGFRVEDNLPR